MIDNMKCIEFLTEYLKACIKYDVQISSCGCCFSPFIAYTDFEEIEVYTSKKILTFSYKGIDYVLNENGDVNKLKNFVEV